MDIFYEVELLGQKADLFLIFWGNSILLSTVAAQAFVPTNSALEFPLLHILTKICWFIDDGHSEMSEVIDYLVWF